MVSSTTDPSHSARSRWTKLRAIRKFISLAHVQASRAPAQLLVNKRFRVGKKIANGAFGQVRLGLDLYNNTSVAIKLESKSAVLPMLSLEYDFYRMLCDSRKRPLKGFPRVYCYGDCGPNYNALVMELLGSNLEEMFRANDKNFSLQTIVCIALQLLERLEVVHQRGIVFRDVKPENFLLRRHDNGLIHMVDFGLAKMWRDPDTGDHVPFDYTHSLAGTTRYMSINAHQGKQQSRRDDLESLGNVFFYFLTRANLPWQGIRCEDGQRRNQLVLDKKEETKIEDLGAPHQFVTYMHYCQTLHFDQKPDYEYLRELFWLLLDRIDGKPGFELTRIQCWNDGTSNPQQDMKESQVDDHDVDDLQESNLEDVQHDDEAGVEPSGADEEIADHQPALSTAGHDAEDVVESDAKVIVALNVEKKNKMRVGCRDRHRERSSLLTRPEMANMERRRDVDLVTLDTCCAGLGFQLRLLNRRNK